jgi:hypothetical protein
MQNVTVVTTCCICGNSHDVEVPYDGYVAWIDGELIQNAMPELSATLREMLMTGICGPCWDRSFGE